VPHSLIFMAIQCVLCSLPCSGPINFQDMKYHKRKFTGEAGISDFIGVCTLINKNVHNNCASTVPVRRKFQHY